MRWSVQEIISRLRPFDNCRILVIGDLMLDEYLWGHIERISPEAPVPILSVVRRQGTLGGAGNVVKNLRSLGVCVTAIGVIGEDGSGDQIVGLLADSGVDVDSIVRDPRRSSTRKVRLMSLEHGQQVFRWDEESTHALTGTVEDNVLSLIEAKLPGVDVVLCSDYLKGMLTRRLLAATFKSGRIGSIPTIVAPKDSDASKYRGATILMPNLRELAQMSGARTKGNGWLAESTKRLAEELSLEALVVTRGSDGMSLFERSNGSIRRLDFPTTARSVYDVTGAGDTAIAAFAAGIASGADRETAVHLANLAAGIKVGKRGTSAVTRTELLALDQPEAWPA